MRMRTVAAIGASLILCTGLLAQAFADELKPIQLPAPKLETGKSLVQALTDRKSQREFSSGALSQQILSNLLWAAWGINRQDKDKRTAPSSFNRQELDVYVTTSDGAYRYDPKGNALVPVASGDIRALTGTQSYFKDAAINLVYVSDLSKMGTERKPPKCIQRLRIPASSPKTFISTVRLKDWLQYFGQELTSRNWPRP